MRKNVKKIIEKILSLLEEVESYEFYRENIKRSVETLFRDYQEGKYTHVEYQKLLYDLLKNRTEEDWIKYYDSYIYTVLKQIEPLLSQIIYYVYNDNSASRLGIAHEGEARREKETRHVALEEDKKHELRKIKEREEGKVEQFVEIEKEPLIGKPASPLKEKFEADVARIREDRERKKRKIEVKLPEIRKTELTYFERLRISFAHYLERRRLAGRKASIKRELEKKHAPSVYMKIIGTIKKLKPQPKKKPKPVVVGRETIFGRISEMLRAKLKPRKRLELEPPKKPKAAAPSKKQAAPKAPRPSFFARLSKNISERFAGEELIPKAEPKAPARKTKEFVPRKDRDLERLVAKLDKIDKSIEELRVEEPKKSLRMRLDLLFIRMHTGIRHIVTAREERVAVPERIERVRVEEAEEKPIEIKIKVPEEKMAAAPGEEKVFVLVAAYRKASQVAVKAAESIKSLLYVSPPKPAEPKPEVKAKEKVQVIIVKAPAPVSRETFIGKAYSKAQERVSAVSLKIKKLLFAPAPSPAELLKIEVKEAKPEKAKETIEIKAEEKLPEKPAAGKKPEVRFKLTWSYIKEAYDRMMAREKKFISKSDTMTPSLQMQSLKEKISILPEEEKITPRLLKEEVDSIRKILEEKKKFKIYQPSFIGSFANATIRKFAFYLIERYPAFFKTLYDNLRLANITLLSNTYVNIMLLGTIVVSALASLFFFGFFLFTNNPLFMIIPKTIIMAIITGGVTFLIFYLYPQMKITGRRASIDTNLPFAINHISAVAGSGVPPTKMFRLIMESKEYGEIAVEIEKIVEYVELFGYDLLTAIRTVALTTPSVPFKEFLEGMVSTIESGGDINIYLKEKTSEAMLNYELDRQKYTETIATYSDVYTGIMIAAPLFFIVALSLVGMLGGKVAGLEVNFLIVVGAYVVIPALNIVFLIFLELTQPKM